MEQDLFARRASVRAYKPDPIPPETVRALLCAALEAPSAGNRQPWHFYVVTNPNVRRELCACAHGQRFVEEAPLAIVVCAEPARSSKRYQERGETLYCLQDTAAAIENILLRAVQAGLGTCWVGAFDEAAAAKALSLPADRRPVAILPVGFPLNAAAKPPRRPLEDAVTFVE